MCTIHGYTATSEQTVRSHELNRGRALPTVPLKAALQSPLSQHAAHPVAGVGDWFAGDCVIAATAADGGAAAALPFPFGPSAVVAAAAAVAGCSVASSSSFTKEVVALSAAATVLLAAVVLAVVVGVGELGAPLVV